MKGSGAFSGADWGEAASAIAPSGERCVTDGAAEMHGVRLSAGVVGEEAAIRSLTDCAELIDEAREADETADLIW